MFEIAALDVGCARTEALVDAYAPGNAQAMKTFLLVVSLAISQNQHSGIAIPTQEPSGSPESICPPFLNGTFLTHLYFFSSFSCDYHHSFDGIIIPTVEHCNRSRDSAGRWAAQACMEEHRGVDE